MADDLISYKFSPGDAITADRLNSLRRNYRSLHGAGVLVQHVGDRAVLRADADAPTALQLIEPFELLGVYAGTESPYWTCRHARTGATVNVAMAPTHRRESWIGSTRRLIGSRHPWVVQYPAEINIAPVWTWARRVGEIVGGISTPPRLAIIERLSPDPYEGETIFAVRAASGVVDADSRPLRWTDINVSGRSWILEKIVALTDDGGIPED